MLFEAKSNHRVWRLTRFFYMSPWRTRKPSTSHRMFTDDMFNAPRQPIKSIKSLSWPGVGPLSPPPQAQQGANFQTSAINYNLTRGARRGREDLLWPINPLIFIPYRNLELICRELCNINHLRHARTTWHELERPAGSISKPFLTSNWGLLFEIWKCFFFFS